MTVPMFITDEGFNKLRTAYRVRKVLQREGKAYLRALHARCGVGLTVEEFDNTVQVLADAGWCFVKEGAQKAKLVVFNEAFNNVTVLTPEAVIQDACKEAQ